jgi:glucoamylase
MDNFGNHIAFGAPGIDPRWTSSAKEGLGTAYHTSCHLWFTISHGIINEIYYPHVDQPNTRDFQFLISDGYSFCHEEKRDLDHSIDYPERNCLYYRIINTDKNGRYRIIKHILTDPHRSVLLLHSKVEILDEKLKGKLHIYALLAPHLRGYGYGNSGWCSVVGGNRFIHAERGDVHLVMGCSTGFLKRSVGYVGYSDGWRDLMDNYRMDWEFFSALDGNIALTGEISLNDTNEFTIAVAFGGSSQSTVTKLLQSISDPFEVHETTYIRQWQRTLLNTEYQYNEFTSDDGHLFRLSRCVLLAHEDKSFEGALVASMSIPWGETKDDKDIGGYHLVWTRDLVQSATALLASGHTNTPLRALIWLAAMQRADGSFPQNSWINGKSYWTNYQLDEIAAPILLAWRLHSHGVSLGLFDPGVLIYRGAGYLIRNGPVTKQERWEENSGYSPSTLATVIASLVCAAEFSRLEIEPDTSEFILDYADWLNSHVEEWTVTNNGELVDGIQSYYIRINPTDPDLPDPHADPDTTMLTIANGGGMHPARNIVGCDFLHLVRFGIRAADDPLIKNSIKVIDKVLKHDLPQGPSWRRYNYDCYGQKDDGSPFDGSGTGHSWPILTGERGHYELAAGNDPKPFIKTMEDFGNAGGMISEQIWDAEDLPDNRMRSGQPTGAAMPLCWAHSEYILLVRSHHDGVCYDKVEPAYQRYVVNQTVNRYEIWSFHHQLRYIPAGKILRIIVSDDAELLLTSDNWSHTNMIHSVLNKSLNLWYCDFPANELIPGTDVEFTFYWKSAFKWEGRNYTVSIKNNN